MSLGERLYELRKSKHLSQEQVAEQLNVTRQTISKWETDESKPDFDKIVPICNLYGISSEQLLKGNVEEQEVVEEEKQVVINTNDIKKKRTFFILSGILCFFLGIIFIILGEETLNLNDGITVSVFLFLCAIGTCLIVYQGVALSGDKNDKEKKEKSLKEKKLASYRQITSGVFAIIYFLVSFLTMAWHLTWLIWIIYAVVFEIIKLIVEMKESENNE